jgi:hypothetical protein
MQPGLYGALQNCQFAISGFAISNRAAESNVSSSDTPGTVLHCFDFAAGSSRFSLMERP